MYKEIDIMSINGLGYLNQINRTHSAMQGSLGKISSGSRFPSASYGPSDYAISVRMNSNTRATQQSLQNTQTANSMLSTAAGGVNSTVNALSSLRDQIIKAANGTNTDSDRATISKTVDQTIATINENSNIQYNGMNLLDGSHPSIAVADSHGYRNVALGNMSAQGLGLADNDGKSTLDLSTNQGIASALDTVDSALNKALDQATDIGAAQQNLNFAANNYSTQILSSTDAESTNSDTDIAAEITRLRSHETLNQLSMMAQKMFMNQQGMALNLLK
jgi:bacterial flagellin family protein